MKPLLTFFLCSAFVVIAARADESDTSFHQLPEVQVTSTRHLSRWLTTPYAMSILKAAEIRQLKGIGFDELLASVPGVVAQSRSGGQDIRIAIRGFGARGAGERSNAGTVRGIRFMLDGFPETEPDGRTSLDLVDLSTASSVEVIRSNASSIWGNASGGVVAIKTMPIFSQPFAREQSTIGSFGLQKHLVSCGAVIGASGRMSVTLSQTDFAGWRAQSSSSRTLLNVGLTLQPSPASSLGLYLAATDNQFQIPGPLTSQQFSSNPQQAQDDSALYDPTYVERNERRLNRLGRIGVTYTHEFDSEHALSASVHVAPKYLQRSERNTFRDFTRYHIGASASYRRTFYRDAVPVNSLVVGVDEAFQDGAILFYNLVNGERGSTLRDDRREGATNLGCFVENQWAAGNRISLLMGLRLDRIDYSYDDHLDPSLDDTKQFTGLSPKIGLSVRLSQVSSLYASFGSGIEVPAGNETSPPETFGEDSLTALNPLLEPIRSISCEAGTKHAIVFDSLAAFRRLSIDAVVYLIETRNDIVPYRGGRFYFTAGKSRRVGLETAVNAELSGGFALRSSLTLSGNTYRSYLIDSIHYGVPGRFADFAGNEMAGVPSLAYAAAIRCTPPWLQFISAELSVQGIGDYFADDANTLTVDAYTTFTSTLSLSGLSIVGDQLALSGFASLSNLTNKRYAGSAFVNPDRSNSTGEAIYLEPALPRNWAASLSLELRL